MPTTSNIYLSQPRLSTHSISNHQSPTTTTTYTTIRTQLNKSTNSSTNFTTSHPHSQQFTDINFLSIHAYSSYRPTFLLAVFVNYSNTNINTFNTSNNKDVIIHRSHKPYSCPSLAILSNPLLYGITATILPISRLLSLLPHASCNTPDLPTFSFQMFTTHATFYFYRTRRNHNSFAYVLNMHNLHLILNNNTSIPVYINTSRYTSVLHSLLLV